jgi:hypothetical protein
MNRKTSTLFMTLAAAMLGLFAVSCSGQFQGKDQGIACLAGLVATE